MTLSELNRDNVYVLHERGKTWLFAVNGIGSYESYGVLVECNLHSWLNASGRSLLGGQSIRNNKYLKTCSRFVRLTSLEKALYGLV